MLKHKSIVLLARISFALKISNRREAKCNAKLNQ
jgi:hypothetical protein